MNTDRGGCGSTALDASDGHLEIALMYFSVSLNSSEMMLLLAGCWHMMPCTSTLSPTEIHSLATLVYTECIADFCCWIESTFCLSFF